LYLVVFGAFRIWHLVPPLLAFLLLVAIALASAILAVAQDSRSLAVAGVTGGFLAPLLASTGQGSHVMLFGFYLVLDIGVLVIAWYKAWRALNLLAFAFTFGIGAIWGAEAYRPEHFATTEPFLIAFFLLYVAIAVLYALRRAPSLKDPVDNILVFGNPLVAAGLQFGMVKEIEYGAAWSAVALGAFYCVLAHQLWRRQRESLQLLVECFVALGLAFATLAIPLAFDGRWTAATWALEGAAALWVGTRQNRWLPRWLGLALQPAAGIAFLSDMQGYTAALAVLNSGFLGGMMIALSGLFCAWYLDRNRTSDVSRVLSPILLTWGIAWWLGIGWYEIHAFVRRDWSPGIQLLHAAGTSLLFVLAHRRLQWTLAAYGALALLPVMVLWTAMWPEAFAHPFAGIGFVAWPLAFVAFYWVLAKVEDDVVRALASASHCVALWLLAIVLGWECAWQIDAAVGEGRIWADIGRPLVPALLAAWIASRREPKHWPLEPHLRVYLAYALAPIMLALWFWVLYINFARNGDPAPLPYVPLLNPLDLSIALIAVIFLTWQRALLRNDPPAALQQAIRSAPVWLGATGFIWANGVLLRSLHHYADVPFRLEAMLRSTLVQTAFSVFWSLLALGAMVFANRRRIRPLWVVRGGAARRRRREALHRRSFEDQRHRAHRVVPRRGSAAARDRLLCAGASAAQGRGIAMRSLLLVSVLAASQRLRNRHARRNSRVPPNSRWKAKARSTRRTCRSRCTRGWSGATSATCACRTAPRKSSPMRWCVPHRASASPHLRSSCRTFRCSARRDGRSRHDAARGAQTRRHREGGRLGRPSAALLPSANRRPTCSMRAQQPPRCASCASTGTARRLHSRSGSRQATTCAPGQGSGSGPLIRLRHGDAVLERNAIQISPTKAKYLRVSWRPSQEPLKITAINASPVDAVAQTPRAWLRVQGTAGPKPGEYVFELPPSLPVDRLRFELPQENTVAASTVVAQPRAGGPERPITSVVLYRMEHRGQKLVNPDLEIGATAEPRWVLRVDARGGGLGSGTPVLHAGYVPHRLVFVARGTPPFRAQFGNKDAVPATLAVQTLVPGYAADKEIPALPARLGEVRTHEIVKPTAAEAARSYAGQIDEKKVWLWSAPRARGARDRRDGIQADAAAARAGRAAEGRGCPAKSASARKRRRRAAILRAVPVSGEANGASSQGGDLPRAQ
jgi:hypothetical protein